MYEHPSTLKTEEDEDKFIQILKDGRKSSLLALPV